MHRHEGLTNLEKDHKNTEVVTAIKIVSTTIIPRIVVIRAPGSLWPIGFSRKTSH